jgi:acetylglutamate kinase
MMENRRILIKYGGNAMTSDDLKTRIAGVIRDLHAEGFEIILVHGGGPFINKALETAGIVSEFFDGQRFTSTEALAHIETVLKGEVNSSLVGLLNRAGLRAVGLSGKDGMMVTAEKRWHLARNSAGDEEKIDIGRVGNVVAVDPGLIESLLARRYVPVIACIASDTAGNDYNINADMLAGHIAASLKTDHYIVLTDVDGLFRDFPDPDSLLHRVATGELPALYGSVIRGGMIPKVKSCEIALAVGARKAVILNGTKPAQIREYLLDDIQHGTQIVKDEM